MTESAVAGWPRVDHAVSFFDDDSDLIPRLAAFVRTGTSAGDAVVVIATKQHRRALRRALASAAGVGADAEIRYLDAGDTLSRFLIDGKPDSTLFREVVDGVFAEAISDGRRLRGFGEMVALLWEEGNIAAAIELEDLWNDYAAEVGLTLLCAYPIAALGNLDAVARVCDQHSQVLPPASYTAHDTIAIEDGAAERSRLFVPAPSAVGAARRFLASTLTDWGADTVLPDALVVVSELATNAIKHASSPFLVALRRTGAHVRISVQDVSQKPAQPRHASLEATGGRGLDLVAKLSADWGVRSDADGKFIWADLALSQHDI